MKVGFLGEVETEHEVALLGRVKGEEEWERIDPARREEGTYVFEVPAKPWGTRYFYKFEGRIEGDESKTSLT